jgi:tetratricopeptide (TPR) repeat protein
MQLYPASQPPEDTAFFESIRYAPRYSYAYPDLTPYNFVQAGLILKMIPDSAGHVGDIRDQGYESVVNRVYHFFNAVLNDDENSRAVLNNETPDQYIKPDAYSFTYYEPDELPPTQAQFAAIIQQRGAAEAIAIFDKFHKLDSNLVLFNEATINYFGYQYLQRGQLDEAIGLFRMNAEAFPQSINVWDSYADGCNAVADTAQAIRCYRKVLELLPGDTQADASLKEVLKNNAENGLQNLQGEQ